MSQTLDCLSHVWGVVLACRQPPKERRAAAQAQFSQHLAKKDKDVSATLSSPEDPL